jgi:hypothetical protein
MMNTFFSMLLLMTPIKAETGHFTIYQDGKKIGSEDFTVRKAPQGYVVEGSTNISDMNISSRMELTEALVPTSYEYSSREGTIRIKVSNPISELESSANGATSSIDFRYPEGAVILDNNFFHHYLILMYRVQAAENMFPVFVPQDMRIGTVSVRSTGSRVYDIDAGDVRLQATTDADGRLMRLTVPDAKVVVER